MQFYLKYSLYLTPSVILERIPTIFFRSEPVVIETATPVIPSPNRPDFIILIALSSFITITSEHSSNTPYGKIHLIQNPSYLRVICQIVRCHHHSIL